MFDVAQTPYWKDVAPFALAELDSFLPPGPPSLGSQEYADAVNEVKSLGAVTSTNRTPEQTQIARFWSDGAGTYTPPGHWNLIAADIANQKGLSLGESARLMAMLNTSLSDVGIAAWKVKYSNDLWRPITAIREAGSDNNDATVADSSWTSLLITPPHPEYVSGHSSFSAAAARVLSEYFGENQSFTTTSLGLPGVQRSFTSFAAAAVEAGRSRIYGGIHYQFSNLADKN